MSQSRSERTHWTRRTCIPSPHVAEHYKGNAERNYNHNVQFNKTNRSFLCERYEYGDFLAYFVYIVLSTNKTKIVFLRLWHHHINNRSYLTPNPHCPPLAVLSSTVFLGAGTSWTYHELASCVISSHCSLCKAHVAQWSTNQRIYMDSITCFWILCLTSLKASKCSSIKFFTNFIWTLGIVCYLHKEKNASRLSDNRS